MSYMRGATNIWSDGEHLHLWADDGLDDWQTMERYDGLPDACGVKIREALIDQLAVMRFAELMNSGRAIPAIDHALMACGGNYGCLALEAFAPALRKFCADSIEPTQPAPLDAPVRAAMYPVPHLAQMLQLQWSEQLARRAGVSVDQWLQAPERHIDYPNQTVAVELMDGSSVSFRWAFALIDEGSRTLAVFTEHSGHHLFPCQEARVTVDGKLFYAARV